MTEPKAALTVVQPATDPADERADDFDRWALRFAAHASGPGGATVLVSRDGRCWAARKTDDGDDWFRPEDCERDTCPPPGEGNGGG